MDLITAGNLGRLIKKNMNKIKQALIGTLIAASLGGSVYLGGEVNRPDCDFVIITESQEEVCLTTEQVKAIIEQINQVDNFRKDLEILGVKSEQARHLAEYMKGNSFTERRETITIPEMQTIIQLYNQAIKELGGNFGRIENKKDLIKKMNSLVGELAKKTLIK